LAEHLGYRVLIETDRQTGEARDVARMQVSRALSEKGDQPVCLLWGGETTVTVTGDGKGGRNQEAALAASLELEGHAAEVVYLSGGTDGIDGPTDAAGAWTTPRTARRARSEGLEPESYLKRNDAYTFFKRIDQLLLPGPTHTNVMDIQVALIQPAGI
jgi:hydroxypyruvate reductase